MTGPGRWLILAAIAASWVSTSADAQGKKEPGHRQLPVGAETQDSSASALPAIDLPEFVITGNEVFDFKELAKAGVDPDLLPEASADREAPVRESAASRTGMAWKERAGFAPPVPGLNGRFSAGYGSYNTPSFEGWLGTHSPRAHILMRGGFVSSDGPVPDADCRRGFGTVSGGWQVPESSPLLPGSMMEGNLGIAGRSYRFYGSRTPDRERTVGTFDAGLAVASTVFDGVDQNTAIALRSTSVDDSADAYEREFTADVHMRGGIEEIDVRGNIGVSWNFLSAPSVRYDPYVLQGQFSGRHHISPKVELRGGVSLYLFRGSDTRTSGRIYPSLGVSWSVLPDVRVFARVDPAIERHRLSDLLEENPYLKTGAAIRPTDHALRFSVGAEGTLASGVTSRVTLTYDQMRDYPLFSDPSLSGSWDLAYGGNTTFMSFEGSLYADLSAHDQAGLTLTARSTENSETLSPVPYVPRLSLSGQYSHRFPFDVTVRSDLQVQGASPADVANTRSISGYAVLSVGADYVVADRLRLLMDVEDILDSEQTSFEGYSGPRRSVRIGLQYSW
jgi:hypothetical protein